jgi:hypothetical protein
MGARRADDSERAGSRFSIIAPAWFAWGPTREPPRLPSARPRGRPAVRPVHRDRDAAGPRLEEFFEVGIDDAHGHPRNTVDPAALGNGAGQALRHVADLRVRGQARRRPLAARERRQSADARRAAAPRRVAEVQAAAEIELAQLRLGELRLFNGPRAAHGLAVVVVAARPAVVLVELGEAVLAQLLLDLEHLAAGETGRHAQAPRVRGGRERARLRRQDGRQPQPQNGDRHHDLEQRKPCFSLAAVHGLH